MKIIATFSALIFSSVAFADHSFKDVVNCNKNVFNAFYNLQKAKGVICGIEHSIQMQVPGFGNNAWRQVAFCYNTEADKVAGEKWLNDNPLKMGAYGLNAAAIFDVAYTWENTCVGQVIYMNLR